MIRRRAAALLLAAVSTVAACTSPGVEVASGTAPAAPATSDVEIPAAPSSELPPAPLAPPRTATPRPQSTGWLTNEREAVQLARESRQPLLIAFFADWSMACKQYDKVTFADPNVRARLLRFVKLRIDATNDEDVTVRALLLKYRITGVPAVLLFDSTGTRHADITELLPAEAFAEKLDAVH